MGLVAHFGTFDVENYGDLLFPAILDHRLGDLGHTFVHVSPQGGPPVWGDCAPTVPAEALAMQGSSLVGVIVGGGHIIHASPTSLKRYDQGGLSSLLAYPSLWLGAAHTATLANAPLCWNAPGVPQDFSPVGGRLVEWAASVTDYLAVRDRTSRARLVEAGVSVPIRVVPDTALEVSRLWSQDELAATFADAFLSRDREVPDRAAVIHLNRRYAGDDLAPLASRLDRIAHRVGATPILIALGPCHGDDRLQRDVGRLMASRPLVIERPRSLREVAACIAHAEVYLGSSLHGMITACAFGRRGMAIVPRAAGTIGKFDGFLEQFQLTPWLSESWEEAEERLDEFIAAPGDPWARVLDIATPVLEEHWAHLRSLLPSPAKTRRNRAPRVARQGALERLAALDPVTVPSAGIYGPLVAEQAMQASRHLKSANEERQHKDAALAERNRLRRDIETLQGATDLLQRELDDLRGERTALQAEVAAERSQHEQALPERERLRAALEQERAQKEQALGERDRYRGEYETLRAVTEAERAAHEQARQERELVFNDLRGEREFLRAELERERERMRAEVAAAHRQAEQSQIAQRRLEDALAAQRSEAAALQRAHEAALHERAREIEGLTTARDLLHAEQERFQATLAAAKAAAAAERGNREQAITERDRSQAEVAKLQAELEAERSLRLSEVNERDQRSAALQRELDQLRTELSRERDDLQRRLDTALAAVTAEQREKERAFTAQDQLADELRRRAEESLRGDEATADLLLAAGRELAQLDALLVSIAAKLPAPSKKKPSRVSRQLEAAQQTLHHVREELGARRTRLEQATGGRPQRHTFDPDRVLPGRPPNGSPPRLATAAAAGQQALAEPHRADAQSAVGAVPAPDENGAARADIVICVHNALDDVRRCLDSVVRNTDARHRVIVVDDGSDAECAAYLQTFVRGHDQFRLLRNVAPSGYTRAANRGLRAATGELVVLLNSDTIVTPGWVERLLECAHSDPRIGIVGPLSNTASYQSVPERFDANGDWASNPLPPDWDIDDIAAAVARVSSRAFPRVPFVNGFCFAIRRTVIDAIGCFDEDGFPDGYGEENDYCLRATDAGFALAIADHAYVYHAKSRSYSHERRRALGKAGRAVLLGKHGLERLESGEAWLRDEPTLAKTRLALGAYLRAAKPKNGALGVLFLLPVSGGGGGAHSVVQEASGMRRLGVNAQVAIRAQHLPRYRESYPAVGDAERLFFPYRTVDELQAYAAGFSVVVATIHTSMPLLAAIAAAHPTVIPAYYIQDYEPCFYAEGSPDWEAATRSYTLVPEAVLFAKTRWLCDGVRALHGVEVHKVSPSLDHDVYYPPAPRRGDGPVRVVAMIRPSSPRRGAGRTMEVLRRLTETCGEQVDVHVFGCTEADLAAAELPLDFPFTNRGVLTREGVADCLRESDVFLDLSDYQAFGRTGLEAMACGCAVVVPALGGTDEYAIDRENALIVDTSQVEACYAAARELVADNELRKRLQQAGAAKAAEYSIDRAARSELDVLRQNLAERQSPTGAVSATFVVAP